MRRAGSRLPSRTPFVITLLAALALAGCANDADGPSAGTTPESQATTTPAVSTPATPVVGTSLAEDFENATVGGAPAGWTVVAGEWSVVENATAPAGGKVLLSDQTDLGETLILADEAGSWSDVEASVQIDVLAGEKGQAGGIVFRYEDEDNYYVVRYNHNELAWNLFRTMGGDREKFEGTPESVDAFQGALHQWFDLRVVAEGAHIQVYSGDLKVVDYNETETGAPQSGQIGLWTRWDSKTQFDAFEVKAPAQTA